MKVKNCILLIFWLMLTIYSCKKDGYEQLTLIIQPDSLTGQDVTISNTSQSSNGKSEGIYISKDYAINRAFSLYSRAVINFDLSSIPIEAKIDSAFLSLFYSKRSEHYRNNDFLIRRIISPWDENTITWNTQPKYSDSNLVILPGIISPYQDYPNINVTKLVWDMLEYKDNSFGFLLSFASETGGYGRLNFASSNNQDKNLRPKLAIYYTFESK